MAVVECLGVTLTPLGILTPTQDSLVHRHAFSFSLQSCICPPPTRQYIYICFKTLLSLTPWIPKDKPSEIPTD